MPTKIRNLRAIKQSGFTLIELIVVIVIVGILAAVAVPKFQDLTVSAQNASNKAVAAELGAAAAIAFAKAKADGTSFTATCEDINDPTKTYMSKTATGYTVTADTANSKLCSVTKTGDTTSTPATFVIPN